VRVDWSTATTAAVLMVLACTLVPLPFQVDARPVTSVPQLFVIGFGPDRGSDVVENVVLFLPFGFTLTGYLTQQGAATLSAVAAVLLLGASCSYAIEVLQRFIPGRFSSLTDVVANTAGVALGFLCHRLWYRHIRHS
jgi:glycopeptide antibiotics resistance protein